MKLSPLRTSTKENFKSNAVVFGSRREFKKAQGTATRQRRAKLNALVNKFSGK